MSMVNRAGDVLQPVEECDKELDLMALQDCSEYVARRVQCVEVGVEAESTRCFFATLIELLSAQVLQVLSRSTRHHSSPKFPPCWENTTVPRILRFDVLIFMSFEVTITYVA